MQSFQLTILLPTKILASSRNHKRHKIYLYKSQETWQTSSYATAALVLKYISFRRLVGGFFFLPVCREIKTSTLDSNIPHEAIVSNR